MYFFYLSNFFYDAMALMCVLFLYFVTFLKKSNGSAGMTFLLRDLWDRKKNESNIETLMKLFVCIGEGK